MDQDSLLTIIKIIAGAFIVAGGTLITLVTWVVAKTFNQNEEIKTAMQAEFQKFGQQLSAVREMMKDEIHALAIRVTAIEEWKKGSDSRKEH